MKFLRIIFTGLLIFCIPAAHFSQVEIDQSVQLTGGTGQSAITGLVDPPVNGTDAVNKDYVDAAVAATGGSVPWTRFQVFNSGGTFTVTVRYYDDQNSSLWSRRRWRVRT